MLHRVSELMTQEARARRSCRGVPAVVEGDVPADGLVFVGRIEVTDAVDVEVVLAHPRFGRVVNRYPLVALRSG